MNAWLEGLMYDPAAPLTFTRGIFWIFLAVVLVGFALLERRVAARNAFLFAVSLFFYWKTSGWFFLILLFSTFTDWYIGRRMEPTEGGRRKAWLALSLALNLLVLGYFKYAYFFADSCNTLLGTQFRPTDVLSELSNAWLGTTLRVDRILLPVGISFFTFQTMSYAIDVYRREIAAVRNPLDFGFYVSFFPQLVAGPIVRAKEFIPQIYRPYAVDRALFGLGLFWILNGLLKKVWLADYVALNLVDRVFADPMAYTSLENLLALYGYSLQVYADFSGYTDMAIGIALWMGFELPVNFRSPYKARNPGDFWKRWHISLSTWLRDYLYIPMGGNRGGTRFTWLMSAIALGFILLMLPGTTPRLVALGAVGLLAGVLWALPTWRTAFVGQTNAFLTMLIGGLWHGASWNFVLWGGLNGLGVWWTKIWTRLRPAAWAHRPALLVAGVFLTFHFITFTRIWFRAGSKTSWEALGTGHTLWEEWFTANAMLSKLFHGWSGTPWSAIVTGYAPVLSVIALGYAIHFLPERWKSGYRSRFQRLSLPVQVIASVVAIALAWQALRAGMQPFIYFQF
jgi:D-alanyl-lipoteichoic acid acyltransferase DltB (MBOAT superfamily)